MTLYLQSLRTSYQRIRKNLPVEYRQAASIQICHTLGELDCFKNAKHIALYSAFNGEVDLNPIWHRAEEQGKICYFPSVNQDCTLSFLKATMDTSFRKNRFGIHEPDVDHQERRLPELLDLILLPLLAFDEHGTRLGTGGGYYDRTLAHIHGPCLIGIAYDFQKQAFIERQPWDIPLTATVTQRAIYWSNT